VGTFGRSWIGVITFDREKGIHVDVVHEAKILSGDPHKEEFRDQWQDASVSLSPLWTMPLRHGADGSTDGPRWVLLFRQELNSFRHELSSFQTRPTAHPLLCDLKERSCRAVDEGLPFYSDPSPAYGQDRGGLYAVDPPCWLLRFDWPAFSQHVVAKLPTAGPMICHDGLFHIAGNHWISGNLADGSTLLDTDAPWQVSTVYTGRTYPHPERVTSSKPHISRLCRSHHYGLLALLTRGSYPVRQGFYQVILPQQVLQKPVADRDR
jgi:hypothetical protein